MTLPDYARDPLISALAAQMKRFRSDRGLTYEQLAEITRMSRRAVIAYERGETMGTLRYWFRIADALDVPFSEFVAPLDREQHS